MHKYSDTSGGPRCSNPCSTTPPSNMMALASTRAGPGAFPNRMAGPPPRRPYTWNDNPYSESHFKTLKYQPQFPKLFRYIEDAKTFSRRPTRPRSPSENPRPACRVKNQAYAIRPQTAIFALLGRCIVWLKHRIDGRTYRRSASRRKLCSSPEGRRHWEVCGRLSERVRQPQFKRGHGDGLECSRHRGSQMLIASIRLSVRLC